MSEITLPIRPSFDESSVLRSSLVESEDNQLRGDIRMLKNSPFYAGFAVDDTAKTKEFYGETLGVFKVVELGGGLLSLHAANGYAVLIYPKPNHQPAAHTILNFPVDDIEAAVDWLTWPASSSSTSQASIAPSRSPAPSPSTRSWRCGR